MSKRILWVILILSIFLFTACNGDSQPTIGNTTALSGFLEIRDDMLYIAPAEVFMLYNPSYEQGFLRDPNDPALRSIIHIDINDSQRLAELGLTLDDFPNGFNINRSDVHQLTFEITPDTQFVFIDSERNFINTTVLEDFLPHLYPTVVHFIEVYNGKVIRLVQEFGFTM